MLLKGKKILLGVTGSIAAYKAAILIRLMIKEGAEVKVIMTPLAKEFITPLTLATLSNNPVYSEFFTRDYGTWHSHVALAEWADLFVIAPLTASTLGKMTNGIADNLLLTTYLSAKCKVILAPAMDMDMYKHPSNQKNLEIIKSYGSIIIEPAEGELASGLWGKGRMEEPEKILKVVIDFFNKSDTSSKKKLQDKKFLVTAGPTYEQIDPVRFIGNHSSGKMGYAIAEALANHGATVTLISGPVQIKLLNDSVKIVPVKSSGEMYNACIKHFTGKLDGVVLAAAVSDFTPVKPESSKIKRGEQSLSIELKPTTDIAFELGKKKKKHQLLIGFALESENEIENARKKLQKKNFDFIVLNSMSDEGAGFDVDTNKITIIDNKNNICKFDLKTKQEVAEDIVNKIEETLDVL